MKTITILIAALSGIAASANAAEPAGSARSEASASAESTVHADTRRYCVADEQTGSRIPRKTCQTRAEWARDGVDVDTFTK